MMNEKAKKIKQLVEKQAWKELGEMGFYSYTLSLKRPNYGPIHRIYGDYTPAVAALCNEETYTHTADLDNEGKTDFFLRWIEDLAITITKGRNEKIKTLFFKKRDC